jgi:hypothetical protein
MRWEQLFEDLEADLDEANRAERTGEVADRTWREVGRQQLTDRLRAAAGGEIVVRISGAGAVRGSIASTGNGWVLVDEASGTQALVPIRHVIAVGGLGRKAEVPGSEGRVGERLGLGYALRGISRDRARVVLTLVDGGALAGVIARVGADFLDLASDVGADTGQVRARSAVPLNAVALIRRAPA